MIFMWKFCHDSCRIMISYFYYIIFKKKIDIILFLFFHILYWIIINSFIMCCFERWILQCSDFWNLLAWSWEIIEYLILFFLSSILFTADHFLTYLNWISFIYVFLINTICQFSESLSFISLFNWLLVIFCLSCSFCLWLSINTYWLWSSILYYLKHEI